MPENTREAKEEAHILLFEPFSTLNTGNVRNKQTLETLDRIYSTLLNVLSEARVSTTTSGSSVQRLIEVKDFAEKL